jgi:hypothetical protein
MTEITDPKRMTEAGDIPAMRCADRAGTYLLKHAGPAICAFLLVFAPSNIWSFVLVSAVAIATMFVISTSSSRPTLLDIGLTAFYFSTCISTVTAYDVATALPQLELRTLFLLLYLTLRCSETIIESLIAALGIGMVIHCIVALAAFYKSYSEWSRLHFSSLVDFRSFVTLTLHGDRPGNHAAIFLIAMTLAMFGIVRYERKSRAITTLCLLMIGLVSISVLLSFSRSLYICALICFIGFGSRLANRSLCRRGPVLVCLAAILTLVVAGMLYIRPVMDAIRDTALFSSHLSQQRSTSGRLSIITTAFHLASQEGLLGAGLSNYALEVRHQRMASPSLLTAHAFNSTLEITIEQGYLGLATLIVVIAGMSQILVKCFRTDLGRVIVGGCTALLLYSLSQTFVVADQATATFLAAFCAVVAKTGDQYV